jgi:5-methylcytosine-specific restriction endonuclease McrA
VSCYSLSNLSDETLLHGLAALVSRERKTIAELLAHLAEVDSRQLHLAAGYPSMQAYCVHALRLSEDMTWKRLQAARAARRFPALFEAVADGRLHLSGICLLAPRMSAENADELMKAAAGKTKGGIEIMLAGRFPRSESFPIVETVSDPEGQPAPGQVGAEPRSDGEGIPLTAEGARAAARRTEIAPIARQRYDISFSIGQVTHDKLQRAQALLSHKIPNGDLAAILDRVLDLAIAQLEKSKFGARSNRRPLKRSSSPRYIPVQIRRAVWQRDGGQCTFVSENGHRCAAHMLLEFDHVLSVARGGQATADNLRLRCRAHNQYGAECEFGSDFVRRKRKKAREERRTRKLAEKSPRAEARARAEEIIPGLRQLGFSVDESRRAASFCESMREASLENRFRAALSYLRPRTITRSAVAASP